MKCDICGEAYPSKYWFKGKDPSGRLICARCAASSGEMVDSGWLDEEDSSGFQLPPSMVKWMTIGSSMLFVVTDFVVETSYIDWRITPTNVAPGCINFLLTFSGWTTLWLGVFTIPRWYSWFAFASLCWVALVVAGR